MLCFAAADAAVTAGFRPLVSTPSPLGPGETTPPAPSCVFIRSLPPLPNPAPVFRAVPPPLTAPPACSGACCSCCGQVRCLCEAAGAACCPKIFAQAGQVRLLDFQATGEDPLVPLTIAFSFPEGGPAGGLPSGVAMPAVAPAKYGCWRQAGQPYAACASVPAAINDVSTQLRWARPGRDSPAMRREGGGGGGRVGEEGGRAQRRARRPVGPRRPVSPRAALGRRRRG
jgi:hypothetical protein